MIELELVYTDYITAKVRALGLSAKVFGVYLEEIGEIESYVYTHKNNQMADMITLNFSSEEQKTQFIMKYL